VRMYKPIKFNGTKKGCSVEVHRNIKKLDQDQCNQVTKSRLHYKLHSNYFTIERIRTKRNIGGFDCQAQEDQDQCNTVQYCEEVKSTF
jgi:hypothetical protein